MDSITYITNLKRKDFTFLVDDLLGVMASDIYKIAKDSKGIDWDDLNEKLSKILIKDISLMGFIVDEKDEPKAIQNELVIMMLSKPSILMIEIPNNKSTCFNNINPNSSSRILTYEELIHFMAEHGYGELTNVYEDRIVFVSKDKFGMYAEDKDPKFDVFMNFKDVK